MSWERNYNIQETKSAFYLNLKPSYFSWPKLRHQQNVKPFDSFSF